MPRLQDQSPGSQGQGKDQDHLSLLPGDLCKEDVTDNRPVCPSPGQTGRAYLRVSARPKRSQAFRLCPAAGSSRQPDHLS
jgi:hypothetical protein